LIGDQEGKNCQEVKGQEESRNTYSLEDKETKGKDTYSMEDKETSFQDR